MALNPDSVGFETEVFTLDYDWQDVALYALGCGAKRDELDFLYEARGPAVLPTYAVVPTFPAIVALIAAVEGDFKGVVHGGQKITLHKPFPSCGTLSTVGKVAGVYDLKRFGSGVFATETRDGEGNLLAETEWNILFRFDGGFGGPAPPKTKRIRPPERDADFRVEEATTQEQALLYRLSGDHNPLHVDPELAKSVGFDAPILHGLCTYGFVGRAVLHEICSGDPTRLRCFAGQFRKPVWPGETIITEGWREDERIILRASTKERPEEYVFSNAYAETSE